MKFFHAVNLSIYLALRRGRRRKKADLHFGPISASLLRRIQPNVLVSGLVLLLSFLQAVASRASPTPPPNVLVIIADQWRFDALGCAGNPDVKTPNLDRLAGESVRFVNAISTCPVCSPMRACFLTGQRPLTHGVFLNDVPLDPNAATIGKVFKAAG